MHTLIQNYCWYKVYTVYIKVSCFCWTLECFMCDQSLKWGQSISGQYCVQLHLLYTCSCPLKTFLPREFSALHSYIPESSSCTLGISRTAWDFLRRALLGLWPLTFLQEIVGTGLKYLVKLMLTLFHYWEYRFCYLVV